MDDEIEKTARTILSSHKDGMLPLPIFNAITQTVVLSPVDLYSFVPEGENLKIVVAKRPTDDEFLAGNWHIPGKIMITVDESFEDTISRVLKTEMSGSKMITKPVKFDSSYQSTLRGKEHVASFWVIVDQPPTPRENEEINAVDVDNLPEPFLSEQIERIERAFILAKDYITSNN